jgi:uncharacterized protein
MKYLVLVLVIAIVGWFLLRARPRTGTAASMPEGVLQPQEVVACSHCGVHLPRDEAVADPRGVFCSQAHRLAGPAGPK